jgi:hypothetical protein
VQHIYKVRTTPEGVTWCSIRKHHPQRPYPVGVMAAAGLESTGLLEALASPAPTPGAGRTSLPSTQSAHNVSPHAGFISLGLPRFTATLPPVPPSGHNVRRWCCLDWWSHMAGSSLSPHGVADGLG